ncbi:hypothetical protein FRC98_14525 [Lujinxingia vulgaris]|uniref:Uncharacterized protein n=1 Tax=Lujinxingia vulgaris TaxID=2600176 RepID=A0A5C6X2A4_9DELT|nr:hypothetical protein [Lujinxingia vulgaris]TXD35883.1 hypothetical protein FRC98_14525 [Lujinxingia vulgaris]
MNHLPRSLWLLAISLLMLALSGCGIDFEARQQLPGQECRFDQDCVEGLVCTQRRCRPMSSLDADLPDSDLPDADTPDTDLPDADTPDSDLPDSFEPDTDIIPGTCDEGDRACADEQTALRCDAAPDGQTAWVPVHCVENEFCAEDRGECLPREQAPCCEDGCGDDQICNECQCIDIDPEVCNFQDQPCEVEGQVANGFICTNFEGNGELTCLGICNGDRSNPSSSCPAPNTHCYLEEGQPNGVCLSNCEQGARCATDDMTCVAYEHDGGFGLCVPTSDDEEIGEECDEDEPFSCADGGLCVQGICRASCRPFGGYGDCEGEDVCLPAGPNTGVCVDPGPNANTSANDACDTSSAICGGDALVCAEAGFTPNADGVCLQICRLNANDCADGSPCFPSGDENEEIGICLTLGAGL